MKGILADDAARSILEIRIVLFLCIFMHTVHYSELIEFSSTTKSITVPKII